MVLNKIDSKEFLINLFADFILGKIDMNEDTVIKVVDCSNFIIVKGKTTSSDVLDLSKISEEFNLKYNLGTKVTHTIDLIEYNQELSPVSEITHTYFNSDNCSYSQKQIELHSTNSTDFINGLKIIDDSSLVTISSFPYGHSLHQGRLFYYYGKHMFYSIPPSYHTNWLTFKISKEKNTDDDFNFAAHTIDGSQDDILTSAILDVYDFNMNWLEEELKKVDWSIELTNPLSEYDFIKKINKDFIMI